MTKFPISSEFRAEQYIHPLLIQSEHLVGADQLYGRWVWNDDTHLLWLQSCGDPLHRHFSEAERSAPNFMENLNWDREIWMSTISALREKLDKPHRRPEDALIEFDALRCEYEQQREQCRLLLALALRCTEDGHSHLDLGDMHRYALTEDERKDTPELPSYDREYWVALARSMPKVIGTPQLNDMKFAEDQVDTPMVLDEDRLYLAKLLGDEVEIAQIIQERWGVGKGDSHNPGLFVLLGGPGAGKTSTIAVRLIRFINAFAGVPKISMAAPTGKAALRMKSALKESIDLLDSGKYVWADGDEALSESEIKHARSQVELIDAFTIHKLLEFNPANKRSRWALGRGRRLDCDLLVIDECSMVSLEVLAHLLRAVPQTAQVWLVGDPDQLASVGVGSVLADIQTAHERHWAGRPDGSRPGYAAERLKKLTTNFRQRLADDGSGKGSPVGELVSAIRNAAYDNGADGLRMLDEAHSGDLPEVKWIEPGHDRNEFRTLLEELRADAVMRCEIAEGRQTAPNNKGPIREMQIALANDSGVDFKQVLCVHRDGDFGVSGVNLYVKSQLGFRASDLWYPGRPVLVTKNDNTKRDAKEKLWNGDTGVIVRDGSSLKLVLTEPAGRGPQPVARLSAHELNYAMTVHKSQGSEYNEVVVMLPSRVSRICTREMLYTAVSRAKKKVTIVGPRAVLEHMLKTPVSRASGLSNRV